MVQLTDVISFSCLYCLLKKFEWFHSESYLCHISMHCIIAFIVVAWHYNQYEAGGIQQTVWSYRDYQDYTRFCNNHKSSWYHLLTPAGGQQGWPIQFFGGGLCHPWLPLWPCPWLELKNEIIFTMLSANYLASLWGNMVCWHLVQLKLWTQWLMKKEVNFHVNNWIINHHFGGNCNIAHPGVVWTTFYICYIWGSAVIYGTWLVLWFRVDTINKQPARYAVSVTGCTTTFPTKILSLLYRLQSHVGSASFLEQVKYAQVKCLELWEALNCSCKYNLQLSHYDLSDLSVLGWDVCRSFVYFITDYFITCVFVFYHWINCNWLSNKKWTSDSE